MTIGAGTTVGALRRDRWAHHGGADNRIFQFNSIGAIPQDKEVRGRADQAVIGDRNTIREFCTLNLGVPQAGGITTVGLTTGSWRTPTSPRLPCGQPPAGQQHHVWQGILHLGDWVTVGDTSGIHQFVKIGAHAMVGFASAVSQDVPPFMLVDGNPLAVRSYNVVGLRRRGFSAERIAAVKRMHKLIYRQGLTLGCRAAVQSWRSPRRRPATTP